LSFAGCRIDTIKSKKVNSLFAILLRKSDLGWHWHFPTEPASPKRYFLIYSFRAAINFRFFLIILTDLIALQVCIIFRSRDFSLSQRIQKLS
jgi:hypothetical protein